MSATVSTLIDIVARIGALLLVANEIRGFVLTAPVFYGLYAAGGTLMAIWIAICSLMGIVLSVAVPLVLAKKVRKHLLSPVR